MRAALEKAIAFHKEKNADVTIVLTHTENPLEYGLALTSPDGKITGFVEKPPVSRVFSDLVNTGIYIVSPRVLDLIPQNTFFDFARDLFPLMLKNKRALYGVTLDGYWCDIGDIGAYLRCSLDVLSGLCPASLDLPCSREGVYAPHGFKLPDGVKLTPPVYIGHGVRLEQGCEIGPQVILGSGAYVGEGARCAARLCWAAASTARSRRHWRRGERGQGQRHAAAVGGGQRRAHRRALHGARRREIYRT